jgi:hypothetical protein
MSKVIVLNELQGESITITEINESVNSYEVNL